MSARSPAVNVTGVGCGRMAEDGRTRPFALTRPSVSWSCAYEHKFPPDPTEFVTFLHVDESNIDKWLAARGRRRSTRTSLSPSVRRDSGGEPSPRLVSPWSFRPCLSGSRLAPMSDPKTHQAQTRLRQSTRASWIKPKPFRTFSGRPGTARQSQRDPRHREARTSRRSTAGSSADGRLTHEPVEPLGVGARGCCTGSRIRPRSGPGAHARRGGTFRR